MKAILLTLLAAALAAPASGQAHDAAPEQTVTLPALVTKAVHSNGELQGLRLELAALQARAEQAGLSPNPTLDYLREGDAAQGGARSWQLSIPLELGGKRSARVDAAAADLAVAELALAAGVLRVQAETIAAYHDAYLAQQRLALAERAAQSGAQTALSTQRRVKAGKVSPVDETRAQLAHAHLKIETIQARSELGKAMLTLALLSGAAPDPSVRLASPQTALPVVPNDKEIAARLLEGPSMQGAGAELAVRGAAVRLERANRMPTIGLIVGTRREGLAQERQTILGLSLPLPLRDRHQGAIREAQLRVEQAETTVTATRQRLLTEALQAATRLQAALAEEQVLREDVLAGAASAYDATRKGFEAGKFGFLDVLDAQRSHVQAQTLHLRAISQAHRAAAELAALIGPTAPSNSSISIQDK
ncbi:TolC family protein [Massilia sp. CF038]|uniref:TolC family protein n=1 Tax=Massilia sp. CF038 TaxID=1881045 RepID=UPI00091F054F|nr:TolC family protein [Massilia sp. CF038]SHG75448.1 outer membrane protein, cobalt-zinc-cadmium efflux system [Massilia sp. CF038]